MAIPYPLTGTGVLNSLAIAAGIEITRGIRYKEGRRGLLDVYAPKGANGAPMVVFFYGGGWEGGERADYRFAAVALARRGFVVAVPDYRVYPENLYPDFLIDGAKALRWARRHAGEFGGDPSLLFLAGHSAGAYIAVMLALDMRWLDAESQDALAGVIGLAGPYDFLPLHGRVVNEIFAPAGDLASTQPITFARGNAAPLLLLSGMTDKTVSPGNSRHLAERIRMLGGDAETRFYPHTSHALILGSFSPLLRPVAPALQHTAAFIKARASIFRPKPGSPHFFRTTPLT
jgi:acetyl esterase/lipase